MCTLVVAWQVFSGTPITVAANRDEAVDRPSDPPLQYRDEPRAIAPRDSRAGGTWIGYNEAGVFVAITNRWVDRDGERSRGQLVADCLETQSASKAVDHVSQAVERDSYAGFNLVVADVERAVLLEYDGDLRLTEFDPGVHVVVNVGANGEFFEPAARPTGGRKQATNAQRLRAVLEATNRETATEWLDRARRALGNHEYGVCVHGDGFGTRSASLIQLQDGNTQVDRYWFADGPPCTTGFERVDQQLWE